MPTIDIFADKLKELWNVPSFTVGKIDSVKEKTVCLYPNSLRARPTLDWNPDSAKLRLQVKIRWGSNIVSAETKVVELKSKLPIVWNHNNKQLTLLCENAAPVCLGTDAKGNFEYSLDLLAVVNF
jgi:hypothetical protein